MAINPLVKIENLAFSYGEREILKNLSFEVGKGQIFCILGPNGSGKTTLIDCLLGIKPISAGNILLEGSSIRRLSCQKRALKIAYVPQSHSRNFSFLVEDVLIMGCAPRTSLFSTPSKDDRKKAGVLLDSVGLSHLLHREYTSLSGGEMQLIMILRALMQETEIIIMDEPTAHLDFHNELWVLETLSRLIKEKNIALIMASHFPNHAFFLKRTGVDTRVGFLAEKRLQSIGAPEETLTTENIERYYQVHAHISSETVGTSTIRHIIPLKSL